MCVVEDFYHCFCVPASCYISTVLSLLWYYPSGHYHYVPSSGLTAPHTHYLLRYRAARTRGEGGRGWGTRLISMQAKHVTEDFILFSLLHFSILLFPSFAINCALSFLFTCYSPLMFLLQDKEPRGIIPLENLSIREVEEPRKPVSVTSLETSPLDHTTSLLSSVSMFIGCLNCNYLS